MKAINTTIQNRSKHARLSSSHFVPTQHLDSAEVGGFLESLHELDVPKQQLLFSIGHQLVRDSTSPALKAFLAEYDYEVVDVPGVPHGAFDVLGSAYQYLNSKRENLEIGSFYTGKAIALDFVNDLEFGFGQTIFDPACGSGAFLFRSKAPADQIWGVDSDPIAVMIAKFNYFIKFPSASAPQIFCDDFFAWYSRNRGLRFDYVVANPPYGANLDLTIIETEHISSGESFSYFVELGFRTLRQGGVLRYLVPESLLNVKRHTDVRDFVLDRTNLKRIKKYSSKFSGVMSDVYLIELDHGCCESTTFVDEVTTEIPKSVFRGLKNHIFAQLHTEDLAIIRKVEKTRKYDLSGSLFGLGVVTGDNKSKLLGRSGPGLEHIYTGKEVMKYRLLPPKHYIAFEREGLQQVAPDEVYRAPAKLVYKVIAKHLRVALDTSGSLTTNSANIVIPAMPGYNIATVMGLLNSNLYSYLYFKLFGGVNKIAKENLRALPFPELTAAQDRQIAMLSLEAWVSGNDQDLQRFICEDVFDLDATQVEYIDGFVRGRMTRGDVSLSPRAAGEASGQASTVDQPNKGPLHDGIGLSA